MTVQLLLLPTFSWCASARSGTSCSPPRSCAPSAPSTRGPDHRAHQGAVRPAAQRQSARQRGVRDRAPGRRSGRRGADQGRPLLPPARPARQPPDPRAPAARAGSVALLRQAPAGARAAHPRQAQQLPAHVPGPGALLRGRDGPRTSSPTAARRTSSWTEADGERGGAAGSAWSSARERPLVAIAPGAAHATKRWPVEHWVELVRRITETGADVAVLGGPDDVGGRRRRSRAPPEAPTSRAWPATLGPAGDRRRDPARRGAHLGRHRRHAHGHGRRHAGRGAVRPDGPAVRVLPLHAPRERRRAAASLPALQRPRQSPLSSRPSPLHAADRCPTSSSPPWPRRSHERLGPGGHRAAPRCCRRPGAGPGARASSPSGSPLRVAQDLVRDPPPPSGPTAAGSRRWSTGSPASPCRRRCGGRWRRRSASCATPARRRRRRC